jgi:hypothetical protein
MCPEICVKLHGTDEEYSYLSPPLPTSLLPPSCQDACIKLGRADGHCKFDKSTNSTQCCECVTEVIPSVAVDLLCIHNLVQTSCNQT